MIFELQQVLGSACQEAHCKGLQCAFRVDERHLPVAPPHVDRELGGDCERVCQLRLARPASGRREMNRIDDQHRGAENIQGPARYCNSSQGASRLTERSLPLLAPEASARIPT